MPPEKVEELRRLTEDIQASARTATPISPKPKSKCIVQLPKDNKWYIINITHFCISFWKKGLVKKLIWERVQMPLNYNNNK